MFVSDTGADAGADAGADDDDDADAADPAGGKCTHFGSKEPIFHPCFFTMTD